MAKKDTYQPLVEVTFRCKPCAATFKAAPARVEDWADDALHPWRYFCACPDCGAEAEQAGFERGLIRAWRSATGPKTAEGIAATAQNLVGHPTPEEALRTRFNRMKHGLNARVATYFPAKPDGYAFCQGCKVDRDFCAEQPACQHQTQHFMLHHAAFEQRNPKHLQGIYADFHGALMATISECLRRIIGEGVTLSTPQTYVDKDGNCLVVQYYDESGQQHTVYDVAAHPLFKPVGELISRVGLSLADMGMTARQVEDEDEVLGRLRAEGEQRATIEEFASRQAKALEGLTSVIQRAQARQNADPVLIEHRSMGGEG